MIFIPCTTGTFALYTSDDEATLALPVEAWDELGAPYIVGAAHLTPAAALPGFLRLEQAAVVLPKVETPVQVSRGRPGPRPKPAVTPWPGPPPASAERGSG